MTVRIYIVPVGLPSFGFWRYTTDFYVVANSKKEAIERVKLTKEFKELLKWGEEIYEKGIEAHNYIVEPPEYPDD